MGKAKPEVMAYSPLRNNGLTVLGEIGPEDMGNSPSSRDMAVHSLLWTRHIRRLSWAIHVIALDVFELA